MSQQEKKSSKQDEPVLEIKPSEEYMPRPLWQRIMAWILIVMIVLATGIYALWGKVIL